MQRLKRSVTEQELKDATRTRMKMIEKATLRFGLAGKDSLGDD